LEEKVSIFFRTLTFTTVRTYSTQLFGRLLSTNTEAVNHVIRGGGPGPATTSQLSRRICENVTGHWGRK